MELTIADGVVALIVIVSAMLAYNRGLTREVMAIGGWLVAALAAFYFAPMLSPLVLEIPAVGDMLRSSTTLTALAAFAVAFVIGLIVLSFFTPLLSSAIHNTPLAPVDRGLGFLFGVARGVLLVGVMYLLYDMLVPENERIAMIEESASHGIIVEAADAIRERAPTEMPEWIQTRIDALLGAPATASDDQAAITGFATNV